MISLVKLLKEEAKLVYRVNGDASERFLKKYPKVKQIMYTLITKNTNIMNGYKAFLKFKDKQEDYLGGRAEQTSSATFGSKTFYKYDFGGVKGGWPEVYQYLYTLKYGGIDGAIVEAKSDYEVYHKSYTSAINAAKAYAEKKGYEINDDDSFRQIGMGPRKPSEGKTNKFSIELSKGGKVQRKKLQIQVYGMRNSYELNAYIQ
jgi:hypothetical protein